MDPLTKSESNETILIDTETTKIDIQTERIMKKKQRINEYNKKWLGAKYNNDPDFRAKSKIRYYSKRYGNDPMLKLILEQDIPVGKKFQMVLQFMANRKI